MMTITYDKQINLIKLNSVEIALLIADLDNVATVRLSTKLNCGTEIVKEYDNSEVLNLDNTDFYISVDDNTVYLKAPAFGLVLFEDGIYEANIRFLTLDAATIQANCTFVDITYKCKVASLLDQILKENEAEADGSQKTSTIAHILHYSMVNGSNCGCNCAELCKIFDALTELLGDITLDSNEDCGC